ncbi:MAG: SufS family cysteine desulfurase [Candidatus Krumholzibacteriota bacterium]|nr:SufS family cysteine desulfurase [Candidatus Krumholzibacteriota bacterium]
MIDIDDIREDFPILSREENGKQICYLDNAATTQKPKRVLDRIIRFYSEEYSSTHRGAHLLSRRATGLYEDARESVRKFLNAEKALEIVFTSGATESINLIAYSFGERFIREDDEIIVTGMEHHANIVPWQRLCRRKKAVLRVIPLEKNGNLRIDKLKNLIKPKTKLISVTHVSNVLGVINPVEKIIEAAHKKDIPVLVDAAQSIQHIPVNVREMDCDFFVFSGHKVYGPTGTGVLYGKENLLKELPPFNTGGGMIKSVSFEKTEYEAVPLKFEAGTGNIAGVIGLAEAIEYIDNIGQGEIEAHENKLLKYLEDELKSLEGVVIYAEGSSKHGSISFNLDGIHHYDAGMILDGLGVAVRTGAHCAEPLMNHYGITGTVRASVALYNNINDLERLITGIKKVSSMMAG